MPLTVEKLLDHDLGAKLHAMIAEFRTDQRTAAEV
jgi:hypothetical protein